MRAYRITVPEQDEDVAVALLWEAGTTGVEVRAAGNGAPSVLLAYFQDGTPPPRLDELPRARVEPTTVPEVDWVARFRESFRPFRAGGFLIAPEWDRPSGGSSMTLLVDPGRAFGTGTHETTRLCLAALEERATARSLGRVLDVGGGTGILGLAAARLGASFVVVTDIDPEAVDAARAHARLNDVRVHVVQADGARAFSHGAFDLVVANLSAPLLLRLAPDLAVLLRRGGTLVLSGLLEADRAEVQVRVQAALEGGPPPRVKRDGEWAALVYEALP